MAIKVSRFPKELKMHSHTPGFVKQFIRRWKALPGRMPEPAKKTIRIVGAGTECRKQVRPYSMELPTGFLYRTEDNLKFSVKPLSRELEIRKENGHQPHEAAPEYYSLFVKMASEWSYGTVTTSCLWRAILNYGPNWGKHRTDDDIILKELKTYGLRISRPRLLLLAIDPSENPAYKGADADEVILHGPVSMRNIYILENPETVSAILGIESETEPAAGMHGVMMNNFAGFDESG